MTLQQLEYIMAVEQHGYFVSAADACGVTQSTLSLMIKKLEEELVNKKINQQMIERSRRIESRMLESQKAQEKREQEEKRKSNEYKGSHFDRKIDEYLYEQSLKKNQEFLKTNPVEYAPYYQEKINEYYLKKNTH